MPSNKRWGKVITMPVPQGDITTSTILNPPLEDVQLPEEPTEVEEKEEEAEADE